MTLLDLPGVRLAADRHPGDGPTVLLLHGLASTRRIWDLCLPHLSGLDVVALDQRGHGGSDRPDGPYDGRTVAADAVAALDGLGAREAVVVGHSWGATTALRVATDPRVLACVCVDGGTDAFAELAPTRAQVREALTPPDMALPLAELRRVVAGGELAAVWTRAHEDAVLSLFEEGDDGLWRRRLPFEAHMAIVDDLLDTDHAALWRDVRCPAWLVACLPSSGGDRLSAAKEAGLGRAAAALADPRLVRVSGGVHDVPLQWPALVAGVVRAARDEAVQRAAAGEGAAA